MIRDCGGLIFLSVVHNYIHTTSKEDDEKDEVKKEKFKPSGLQV